MAEDFILVDEPVAWIDVEWNSVAVGDANNASVGVHRAIRMKIAFLPRTEWLDMLPVSVGGTGKVTKDVNALALEQSRDWAAVVDEDKRPIAFSIVKLNQMLELEPGFAGGFELSFAMAQAGRGKAREKNSPGSPPAGPAAGTRKPRARKASARK
jgi:hypothetical protein